MKIIIEKGDSEEKVKMAEALLANGLVSAIERAEVKVDVVSKSNEEVAAAVAEVTRLFGVGAQWTAVYRVLVDFCGWDSDVAAFCRRMNLIIKDVKVSFDCNYQAIQKPLAANGILRKDFKAANGILRKDFKAWQKYRAPKGDRVFPRQLFIAEKLLKLLSINA